MKKYLPLLIVLILFAAYGFIACSNEIDDEIEALMQVDESITLTTDETTDETTYEEKLDHIAYTDHRGRDWKVYAYSFTNQHHANGYVIFTSITRQDNRQNRFEKWEIEYTVDMYINDIHYDLKSRFNGEQEVQDVVLQSDERFEHAFRTAEAIYIAWEDTGDNPVSIERVKQAGERMQGRKVGVMK